MKHIGWCLDQIQITMANIPHQVEDAGDKKKAHDIMNKVEVLSQTLEKLILNSQFQTDLRALENSQIQQFQLQAHQIKELIKDLEHALQTIGLFIREMRHNIDNNSQEWTKNADKIVLMIDQKFGGDMGELKKEFEVVIHAQDTLAQLQIH
jgi:archaellum component FlaC